MYPYSFIAYQSGVGAVGNSSSNGTCDGDAIDWIFHVFRECVYNTREEVGFLLGLISICCWVCASVPNAHEEWFYQRSLSAECFFNRHLVYACQLIENYRKQKVDEAISFAFLLFWLFGDSTNLIGCVLTKQLPIQLYTAVYYVSMDIIMILQFLYYYRKHKKSCTNSDGNSNTVLSNNTVINSPKQIVAALCFMCFLPLPIFKQNEIMSLVSQKVVVADQPWRNRNLLGSPLIPDDPEEIVGYVIGCVSSLFYLGSRLPQIIKNMKRKKTEGVSIHMFLLAVLGNTLYGSSILLQEPGAGHTKLQFFIGHLPWLIGSLGTMSLDFTILGQIIYYDHKFCWRRNNSDELEEPLLV